MDTAEDSFNFLVKSSKNDAESVGSLSELKIMSLVQSHPLLVETPGQTSQRPPKRPNRKKRKFLIINSIWCVLIIEGFLMLMYFHNSGEVILK